MVNGETVYLSPEEEQEVLAEWKANEEKLASTAYIEQRQRAYPPIGEQLDMLWHSMDRDEIQGKGTPFYNSIKLVKDTIKKPEVK